MRSAALVATLLSIVVALAGVPAGAAGAERDCLRDLRGVDLQSATVSDLQRAMEAGRISSVDLVEAYLARMAAYDTEGVKLNSVRSVNPTARAQAASLDAERAAGNARGPLHGVPVLLKDNVGTTDVPTTAGSIALENSIPKQEAFLTQRLRAAGAVILGKANLSEFANWVQLGMPNGYSSLGGQVLNAYDGGDPSGSSSGSGVAASMALAAGTIGSETSLSILAPSIENSVVGVKPTVGLVSRAGIIPLSPSFDTAGPMTRNVTDAAAILAAVAGTDPRDPATEGAKAGDYLGALKPEALKGKRLAYSSADMDALGSDELDLWQATLDKLEQLGATLVEVRALDGSETPIVAGELAAIPNEFKYGLNKYLAEEASPPSGVKTLSDIIEFNRRHPDRVKYGQNLLEASDATPGNGQLALAQTQPVIQAARVSIDAALAEGDADAIVAPNFLQGRKGAAAGYPTVILPVGYPGGVSRMSAAFMGTAYTEADLLGFAYALERATQARVTPTAIDDPFTTPASCAAASRAPFVAPAEKAETRAKAKKRCKKVRVKRKGKPAKYKKVCRKKKKPRRSRR